MKKHKSLKADELFVDVLDYAFTEWLVRRELFVAFRSNFARTFVSMGSFRDRLRDHIRYSLLDPQLGPTSLISSAFPFVSTPEGYEFWLKQSLAWRRFYDKFQKKH